MSADAPKQYWITDVGEYEYPVYTVTSERKDDDDMLVYLTDQQAGVYVKIHQLWLEAQGELAQAYYYGVSVVPR